MLAQHRESADAGMNIGALAAIPRRRSIATTTISSRRWTGRGRARAASRNRPVDAEKGTRNERARLGQAKQQKLQLGEEQQANGSGAGRPAPPPAMVSSRGGRWRVAIDSPRELGNPTSNNGRLLRRHRQQIQRRRPVTPGAWEVARLDRRIHRCRELLQRLGSTSRAGRAGQRAGRQFGAALRNSVGVTRKRL